MMTARRRILKGGVATSLVGIAFGLIPLLRNPPPAHPKPRLDIERAVYLVGDDSCYRPITLDPACEPLLLKLGR